VSEPRFESSASDWSPPPAEPSYRPEPREPAPSEPAPREVSPSDSAPREPSSSERPPN
jgi:hypothetical protein